MRRPERTAEAPPRIAIYARYSTDKQQAVSVERQVRTCRDFAERQGWGAIPDAAIFADDAVSGAMVRRTRYQELLKQIAAGHGRPPYDVILVEDFSRLGRNFGGRFGGRCSLCRLV